MRILIVNAYYARKGGAETYVHMLLSALRERGHDTAIFAGHTDGDVDATDARVVQRPDFDIYKFVEDERVSESFLDFQRSFRPDVIHVHNLFGLPLEFVRTVGATGIPTVMTLHDPYLFCSNSWCALPDGTICEGGAGKKCFQHGCEQNAPFDGRTVLASCMRLRLVRKHFDAFISPSEFLADLGRRHGLRNVHQIPYWADGDSFGGRETIARIRQENPREPARMLFVGRLEAEKGLDYLIEAMPRIHESVPAAKLFVVGDGSRREALEYQVEEAELEESVRFLGKMPHDEVMAHLSRARVHVQPSIWCENSALACYESMLAGIPMVASRIGGFPGIVRDSVTGLLVTPRDPKDLAEKIVWILTDAALWAKLSSNCEKELERYRREDQLDRVQDVYRQVTEAGHGGAEVDPFDGDVLTAMHHLNVEMEWIKWSCGKGGGKVRVALNRSLDAAFGVLKRFKR